jgi:hypothetical protein
MLSTGVEMTETTKSASLNMYLVINKGMTTLILPKFSRHDFRNVLTFDIRILCYIDVIQRNEHSPKVWFITPGTFSVCVIKFRVKYEGVLISP